MSILRPYELYILYFFRPLKGINIESDFFFVPLESRQEWTLDTGMVQSLEVEGVDTWGLPRIMFVVNHSSPIYRILDGIGQFFDL